MYHNLESELLLLDDPGGTLPGPPLEAVKDTSVNGRGDRQHHRRPFNVELEERLAASETRLCKAVLPNTTNHYNTLFGGTAMALMDEVAFICATRFSRKQVVTASSDRIDFKRPIPAGTIIELVARVSYVGRTSLKVRVDIHLEEMFGFAREKAIKGEFTFVAVDDDKRPINIL